MCKHIEQTVLKRRNTNDYQIHEMFNILAIKEMQIGSAPRLHLTPAKTSKPRPHR
jgi:hypothetical protein